MDDLIVDACCFINIYASGRIRDLLRDTGWSWHLTRVAMSEAIYIRERDPQGEIVKTPVHVQPLLKAGLLRQQDISDADEAALYVRLAAELDDGEAMALALAKQRNWKLATDDRKARRMAGDLGVDVLTTPEILRKWSQLSNPDPALVAKILRDIEFGAGFTPAVSMPGHDWWVSALATF